jgi:SpoVK/Ycf46/Vps4 family AAA+-type ATPase
MTMLAMDGATVQSKWVGESEKLIKAAFTLAEKLHPCILFIDEADALFGQRTCGQRKYEREIVNQFLEEMDGLSSSKKAPFVIVATNRPADLDEAFIRRLPQKVLFSLPTLEQRKDIFGVFLKDEDLSDCVRLELLAADTEGFSGSDIRSLCASAALAWSMEQSEISTASCDGEEPPALRLTAEHFQSAFETTTPSVSKQSMIDIERFERRFIKKLPKQSKNVAVPLQGAFYDPRKGGQ